MEESRRPASRGRSRSAVRLKRPPGFDPAHLIEDLKQGLRGDGAAVENRRWRPTSSPTAVRAAAFMRYLAAIGQPF
jgi:hypothetical protein